MTLEEAKQFLQDHTDPTQMTQEDILNYKLAIKIVAGMPLSIPE